MEHQLIAKFLDLLEIIVKKGDRKYDYNSFKKDLAEVTTEFIDESEEERSQRNIAASMTEEEEILPGIVSIFF